MTINESNPLRNLPCALALGNMLAHKYGDEEARRQVQRLRNVVRQHGSDAVCRAMWEDERAILASPEADGFTPAERDDVRLLFATKRNAVRHYAATLGVSL